MAIYLSVLGYELIQFLGFASESASGVGIGERQGEMNINETRHALNR